MLRRLLVPMACLAALAALAAPASAQTKLLRFPDIHGDWVVFSHAGDLWLASTEGGLATRLTAHPGLELFPRFSPGRIAHCIHRAVRRRRAGLRHARVGRRPAAAHVLSGARSAGAALGLRQPGLRLVARRLGRSCSGRCATARTCPTAAVPCSSADGGLPIPAADARVRGRGPVARRLARRLLPLFRDFRTWKRYEGGWAQELYIFDRETHVVDRVTTHRRADRGSDVDRQRDLLHLGPGRHAQPVQLRPRLARDDAAHRQRHLGRALAG